MPPMMRLAAVPGLRDWPLCVQDIFPYRISSLPIAGSGQSECRRRLGGRCGWINQRCPELGGQVDEVGDGYRAVVVDVAVGVGGVALVEVGSQRNEIRDG